MTIVVKKVIKLYKAVKCKKKLHCKIFTFLILHNQKSIGIYSYYTIIQKEKTTFYCYLIYKFNFTALKSKDK